MQLKCSDDCVRIWNINSNLRNSVSIVLNKLENPTANTRSFSNEERKPVVINPQMSNDENISQEIINDLSKRSIEELIYYNFNQEDYIAEFTNKQRTQNNQLLQEITELSGKILFNLTENTEKLKSQYECVKTEIDDYIKKYEESEKELKDAYSVKQTLDSKFTVGKLIDEVTKFNEENYQKPRQKLISDFLSKKIDFETFQRDFKEISKKYHYYSIIKEKLNLIK